MSTELPPKAVELAPLLSRSVDSELPERELRALLSDLAREARALGLRVEQLLVLLKAAEEMDRLRGRIEAWVKRADAAGGTRNRGEVRVYRDHRNPQVGCAEGRTRIKAHPSKQKNKGAGNHKNKIVSWKNPHFAVRPILTETRTEDDSQRHCGKSSHGVNHSRTSEVDVSVTKIQGRANLR